MSANDGETVAIGGLIRKSDTKNENKIPWFGDLPYVGAAVPLPHAGQEEDRAAGHPDAARRPLQADADRILAEESRRMDWILGDVMRIHGTSGMEPIIPAPGGMDGRCQRPAAVRRPGLPRPASAATPWPAPAPAAACCRRRRRCRQGPPAGASRRARRAGCRSASNRHRHR